MPYSITEVPATPIKIAVSITDGTGEGTNEVNPNSVTPDRFSIQKGTDPAQTLSLVPNTTFDTSDPTKITGVLQWPGSTQLNPTDDADSRYYLRVGGIADTATPTPNVIANGTVVDFFNVAISQEAANVGAAPKLIRAEVEAADLGKIVLTFDKDLDTTKTPELTDFTVSTGNLFGLSMGTREVNITVNGDYPPGSTFTLNYTPGATPITATDGGVAEAIQNKTVTVDDGVPQVQPGSPFVVNGKVRIRYSTSLQTTDVPGIDAYTIQGDRTFTVTGVTVALGYVDLSYTPEFNPGETASLSYTVPATTPLISTVDQPAPAFTGLNIDRIPAA